MKFDCDLAFRRNLGFISPVDQARLKNSRVAIAGLGGTGGAQALALARMGVGKFTLADPDTFEVVNFNRQLGANMQTLGRNKAVVAKEMILEINPEADVRLFEGGITRDNVYDFLDNAEVVLDSLDFYCFGERFFLYEAARARNLWVFTAPPLGFGFTMLAFDPMGASFKEYFGFRDYMDEKEMLARFIAGLDPKNYMLKYLDRSQIDPSKGRVPSVGAAPFMIAGAIAAEVTALLSGTPPKAAPYVYQFDAKLKKFWAGTYNHTSLFQKFRRSMISRLL